MKPIFVEFGKKQTSDLVNHQIFVAQATDKHALDSVSRQEFVAVSRASTTTQMLDSVSHQKFVAQAPTAVSARTLRFDESRIALRAVNRDMIPADVPHPSTPPLDVPHIAEQTGNLFSVPSQLGQKWYLPSFSLIDDPDLAFGFAASQTAEIEQATGNPFNKCRFTMTIKKIIPSDAIAWSAENPKGNLREVPLQNLMGDIVIQMVNQQGISESFACSATLTPNDDGTYLFAVDNIFGIRVISLYQGLIAGSSVRCRVSASYQAWGRIPQSHISSNMAMLGTIPIPYSISLDINRKYEADLYRLKYTIASISTPHVIINAEDLRNFNAHQTEFVEFRTLGDVSARYPSISKLYLGVVSRTILVIPSRYVILRESDSCAAVCNALVDSSPGLNAGCKFQFSFTLIPDVSSIDLLLLINEINDQSELELHNLTFHLPRSFKLESESELVTPFLTSFHFVNEATDLHGVTLSTEIREQVGGTPAVANANMFIAQLRITHEPFLTGMLGIRLDDAFPIPIEVPVLLNFTNTQTNGSAGMALRVDEANQKAILENGSSFDLFVTRIALLTPQNVSVVPVGEVIPAKGIFAMDLPADHKELGLLCDCELQIADNLTKTDLFKFVQFQTVDVQNVQYLFSVNATKVNFVTMGIDRIDILITLLNAQDVAITPMVLHKDRPFDSTKILLPLEQAMTELSSMLIAKLNFLDSTKPPVQLTLQNDFSQHPIFLLDDLNEVC
ncbi:hypothetical protein [Nitrosomonas sp. Is79A3]|uniref:hypothetical protein n=1 Tax=Nitrosomonas sp. (strain Is79A3) TaxID=261292 RepID=UPI0012E9D484